MCCFVLHFVSCSKKNCLGFCVSLSRSEVLGSLITAQIKTFASCCSSTRQYVIHKFIINYNVIIRIVRFV